MNEAFIDKLQSDIESDIDKYMAGDDDSLNRLSLLLGILISYRTNMMMDTGSTVLDAFGSNEIEGIKEFIEKYK